MADQNGGRRTDAKRDHENESQDLEGNGIARGRHDANAAGDQATPPQQKWSFAGPFGTYDRAQLQRGFKVYREVCQVCHGLKLVAFRNLADLGYSEAQVKAIAAEYKVQDGPNDQGAIATPKGQIIKRPAKLSDPILGPMYPADDLDGAEQRLRDFLVGRFGGPPRYIEQRGHPRLRMRHMPFPIDVAARDRWLLLMGRALDEAQLPAHVDAMLRDFFIGVATMMINRRG